MNAAQGVCLVVGMAAVAGCSALPGADKNAAAAQAATPVVVYAAGSLRDALTEVAAEYEARTGQPIALTFGASGLLRGRLEKGEPAHVFASADTEHPERLAALGSWKPPVVFVRNSLCALVQPGLNVTPDQLLTSLLRPDVRLGTSTPKADPAGDYAWALFAKAENASPGARAKLEAKALPLTGGPASPQPPAGRNVYGWVMEQQQADVFLTYCTNAVVAARQVPGLQVVSVPPLLQVGAAYGLTVRADAPAAAQAFARAVLDAPAQVVFARHGFQSP